MSKTLRTICEKFRHLAVSESGQDLVEYGLMVTLLALACISGMQGPANSVNQIFGQVSTALAPSQNHGENGWGDGGGGGRHGGGGGGHHWGGGGHHFGF